MEPRGHRAGKSSSFEEVACHMMGLINQCRGTQSRVFALSNSGTGLETQATSTAISHSHWETCGRTEILLAHFIHIMYTLLRQAYCMEMRNAAVDSDSKCLSFPFFKATFDAFPLLFSRAATTHLLRVCYRIRMCWTIAAWPA